MVSLLGSLEEMVKLPVVGGRVCSECGTRPGAQGPTWAVLRLLGQLGP